MHAEDISRQRASIQRETLGAHVALASELLREQQLSSGSSHFSCDDAIVESSPDCTLPLKNTKEYDDASQQPKASSSFRNAYLSPLVAAPGNMFRVPLLSFTRCV